MTLIGIAMTMPAMTLTLPLKVGPNWVINSWDIAKLSPIPSEAGLSKLCNHIGTATANRHRQTATARASESTLLDFVGSWNSE